MFIVSYGGSLAFEGKSIKVNVPIETSNGFYGRKTKKFGFSVHERWWFNVHFLLDLFDKLKNFTWSLQGPSENIIRATSKLTSFYEKLILWKRKFSSEIFDEFPTVDKSPLKWDHSRNIRHTDWSCSYNFQNYFQNSAFVTINMKLIHSEKAKLPIFLPNKKNSLLIYVTQFLPISLALRSFDEFWMFTKKSYQMISSKSCLNYFTTCIFMISRVSTFSTD